MGGAGGVLVQVGVCPVFARDRGMLIAISVGVTLVIAGGVLTANIVIGVCPAFGIGAVLIPKRIVLEEVGIKLTFNKVLHK